MEASKICLLIKYFEANFLWKVSLKILNSGIILKIFIHAAITTWDKRQSKTVLGQSVSLKKGIFECKMVTDVGNDTHLPPWEDIHTLSCNSHPYRKVHNFQNPEL